MTLQELADDIGSKSLGRAGYGGDDHIESRVHTAMIKVASETMPLSLVIENPNGHVLLRRIDSTTWIRKPEKPDLKSGVGLDMDDDLLDAVELYVMAGLEPQRAKTLMGSFNAQIIQYNEKLVETFLSESSDDSYKNHRFP